MSNPHGGRHPTLFKLPEGWVVVKQHRGITTIKPISEVEKDGKKIIANWADKTGIMKMEGE